MDQETSKTRLADFGQKGAALYNSYHFLTQTTAAYTRIAEIDSAEIQWQVSADKLLGDVGDFFKIWEIVYNDEDEVIENNVHDQFIRRASRRVELLLLGIDTWRNRVRLIQLMITIESKWQSILGRLVETYQEHHEMLNQLIASSQDRVRDLEGWQIEVIRKDRDLDENYQLSQKLTAELG